MAYSPFILSFCPYREGAVFPLIIAMLPNERAIAQRGQRGYVLYALRYPTVGYGKWELILRNRWVYLI